MSTASLKDVTQAMLEFLHNTGIKESYLVVPCAGLSNAAVQTYWRKLQIANTLKYRWSDADKPTAVSVTEYCFNTPNIYFVVDVETGQLVAEFAMHNFTGKAAQVHFSMAPDQSTKLNIFLADEVSNMILNQWKDVENLEESYIDTLFGLTPVDNRAACIFIRKAGFKAIGTLISGATYLGETTDALLTTKSRLI